MSRTKRNSLMIVLFFVFVASLISLLAFNVTKNINASADETTTPAHTGCVTGMSVSLNESIVVKYYATIDSSYSDPTATITYRGNTYNVAGEASGAEYVFTFSGVTPRYIDKTMDVSISAAIDGSSTEIGTATGYSVQWYCEYVIESDASTLGITSLQYSFLREIAVDLLNYGAAVQTYKGDAVTANTGLTEEQQEYATDFTAPVSSSQLTALEGAAAVWKSAGLYCDSELALYFKLYVPDTLSSDDLTLKVGDGSAVFAYSEEITEGTYADGYSLYTYYYYVSPVQFSESYAVQLYSGETAISGSLQYGVNDYVANMYQSTTTGTAELVKAVYGYGQAAYAYVNYSSLSYSVTTEPTETTAGEATATLGSYTYTVDLPKVSTADYTYSSKTDNASGMAYAPTLTFTLNDTTYVSGYSVSVTADSWLVVSGNVYTAYDLSSVWGVENASTKLSGTVADGNSTITLNNDVTFGSLSLYGDFELSGNYTLTVSDTIYIYNNCTIASGLTVESSTSGDGVDLYGALVINGVLKAETDDSGSNKQGILYCADNASVTVNGTLSVANKGLGVYMQASYSYTSFTVNEGASVTLSDYTHSFIGNATNSVLTINGGTMTVTNTNNSNAILDENSSLTINLNGGTLTASGNVSAQEVVVKGGSLSATSGVYTIKNIAMHSGALSFDATLNNDILVVKGGELSVTISTDAPAIQPASTNGTCLYYFFGGTTTLTRTYETKGYAGLFSNGTQNNIVLAIGGHPVITVSGFDYGATFLSDTANSYLFTKYDSTIEADSGDTSKTYGYNYTGCNNGISASGYDVWNIVTTSTYWAYAGLTISAYSELQNQALSEANINGEVDFAGLVSGLSS